LDGKVQRVILATAGSSDYQNATLRSFPILGGINGVILIEYRLTSGGHAFSDHFLDTKVLHFAKVGFDRKPLDP
jgi:hypothetical protein